MESYISEQQAGEILDEMISKAGEDNQQDSEKNWAELVKAARTFLREKREAEKLYKNTIKNFKQDLTSGDVSSLVSKSKAKLLEIQTKYRAAFKFDDALTQYRGRQPKKAIFVYIGGDGVPKSIEMSMEELVNYIDKKGRIYQNVAELFNNQREELEKAKEEELNQEHINMARAAYMGTSSRLNRFFETHRGHQKQSGILMWRLNKDWILARVNNLGVVKESYVSALMTKHKTDLDYLCGNDMGVAPYYSHALIESFFVNYLSGVTNRPAIIEEDVLTEDAQYAVKGNKAQMPGLTQYVTMATFISQSTNLLTPKDLEEYLKTNMDKNTHLSKIIATTGETVDEKYLKMREELGWKQPIEVKYDLSISYY